MKRNVIFQFLQARLNMHISHILFSDGEYIFSKKDGNMYDEEEGNLFENWIFEGVRKHNEIHLRCSST